MVLLNSQSPTSDTYPQAASKGVCLRLQSLVVDALLTAPGRGLFYTAIQFAKREPKAEKTFLVGKAETHKPWSPRTWESPFFLPVLKRKPGIKTTKERHALCSGQADRCLKWRSGRGILCSEAKLCSHQLVGGFFQSS